MNYKYFTFKEDVYIIKTVVKEVSNNYKTVKCRSTAIRTKSTITTTLEYVLFEQATSSTTTEWDFRLSGRR